MKEKRVLFSIIVPVYQVENYIAQCIESLLPQCQENSEIIIVDDGSCDKSGKIADEYAEKYECVRVIHQENKGLSEARNVGIHYAQGAYCVFLDGDDMLCENALDSLKKCIENRPNTEVVMHRSKEIDSTERIKECSYWFDETQLQNLSASEAYENIQKLPGLVLSAWLFSVKTDYIRKNDFYFPKGFLHEDEEWIPKILLNAKIIAYNNTCFYIYRIDREWSITKTPNIKREFDKLEIIDLLEQEFDKEKYSADIKKIMKKRIQSIYFGVICSAWQYRNKETYTELVQLLKKKQSLLHGSSCLKHKACYIFSVFIGIKGTCFCFWCINRLRLIFKNSFRLFLNGYNSIQNSEKGMEEESAI